MKTLLILRHGKAESYNGQGDHERVLTDRGVRDATAAGVWLKDNGLAPDLIVSSDAVRARQTADLAGAAAECRGEVELESSIYEASLSDLLDVVYKLPDRADRILIVGHNPGFEDLVRYLANESLKLASMPTASIVALSFDTDGWASLAQHSGKAEGYFTPH